MKASTSGLLDTLDRRCSEDHLVGGIAKCKKLKEKVFPKLYKKAVDEFEHTSENMLRSIAVYYSKGVMGKIKYMSVYRASTYSYSAHKKKAVRMTVANCPIPRLVPYHRLTAYVKSIEIGKLHSVRDTLCDGLEEKDKVSGCYRELEELLLKLAEFYLSNDLHELLTFTETNTFHVALGGDGAPFGKDDSACAWLVSILNIGQGVLSSNENFLLFGANCSENCVPVTRFLQKLLTDIMRIENTTYTISCNNEIVSVKFVISELPNDMKMLAFLGGELSNSAKFFSSFGNVTLESARKITGTFGPLPSDTWKPWKYPDRLKVARQVERLKSSLAKSKLSARTKRSKVTSFIAEQKSRQEFVPIIGELIDRAHVDPLHLKNNACALAHRYILHIALAMANLPSSVNCFSQVSSLSPFFKYVEALRSKCSLSRLANKVIRWFNETNGTGKEFDYRFTGKDSRMFLHNFMFLIDILEKDSTGMHSKHLHIHAFLCLCLRDSVSLFSRINITDRQVSMLKQHCSDFVRGYTLFFSVNPTIWTLGYVVPVHTMEMKGKYGLGLGINSMEGREAKHIAISRYCKNTAYLYRWEQVFRHEYISLIWLREKGYNISNTSLNSRKLSYLPKRVINDSDEYCKCGLGKMASTDDQCRFCSHDLRAKIKVSIEKGKILV